MNKAPRYLPLILPSKARISKMEAWPVSIKFNSQWVSKKKKKERFETFLKLVAKQVSCVPSFIYMPSQVFHQDTQKPKIMILFLLSLMVARINILEGIAMGSSNVSYWPLQFLKSSRLPLFVKYYDVSFTTEQMWFFFTTQIYDGIMILLYKKFIILCGEDSIVSF